MNTPDTEKSNPPKVDPRLAKLPAWARQHIAELNQRVARAEREAATIPWTQPGMEWFTLLKDSEPETLFLCDKNGTRAIASVGKGDYVFVGRAAKSKHSVKPC